MIFTFQGVFDVSLTQENLPTKTLNPKVSSFVIPSFSPLSPLQKSEVKHLNSTHRQSKSRHAKKNRATISNVRPKVLRPYPEIA